MAPAPGLLHVEGWVGSRQYLCSRRASMWSCSRGCLETDRQCRIYAPDSKGVARWNPASECLIINDWFKAWHYLSKRVLAKVCISPSRRYRPHCLNPPAPPVLVPCGPPGRRSGPTARFLCRPGSTRVRVRDQTPASSVGCITARRTRAEFAERLMCYAVAYCESIKGAMITVTRRWIFGPVTLFVLFQCRNVRCSASEILYRI
jgi:hypothetical protein